MSLVSFFISRCIFFCTHVGLRWPLHYDGWMDGCKNMSLVSNCYKCGPIKYIYLYHCLHPVCYLISLFGFSPFSPPCVGFDPVTPLIIPLLKKKEKKGENLSADEASVQISVCCLLEIAVDMLSLHKQTLAIKMSLQVGQ